MKALLLMMVPIAASAGSGDRHIPHGELSPQVIEKAFDSPVGEVEFTAVGGSGHSAMLRNVKGRLMGFTEVRGSEECESWFMSDKSNDLPRNCQFFFFDENSGRTLEVRGDELEESSLFGVASGELRGRADVAL